MSVIGKARAEVGQWCRKNLPEINVRGGAYLNNSMCHQNAVHFAWKHNEDKIALVMTVDESDDWATLHFVNINNDGEYIDNTLGNLTGSFYDTKYYLIKIINKDNFKAVMSTFNEYLSIYKKKLKWTTRLLLGKERCC